MSIADSTVRTDTPDKTLLTTHHPLPTKTATPDKTPETGNQQPETDTKPATTHYPLLTNHYPLDV
ncbi:MAG: hypothetical protein LBG72_00230 [Spirochaetaceae bacterium]|nr:hypothetical protein [Spirochaetaceae bacterium]